MAAGTVEVDLGRAYQLRYDHNALADLDSALIRDLGATLFDAWTEGGENDVAPKLIGPGGLRIMLWAGLKWDIPKFTISAAGKLLEKAAELKVDRAEIVRQCMMGIMKSGMFGDPDEIEKSMEEAFQEGKAEATPAISPATSPTT